MASEDNKLTAILGSFDRFYNLHVTVSKERDEYAQKLSSYTSENERIQKANEKLQKDLKSFHEMIGNFHQQVTEIDVLKERNRDLQEKMNILEQDLKAREEQFEGTIQQQQKANEEKLALMLESKEKTAAAERQRMQEMIEEKKKDIAQFKDAIATAQTEKEDKITVLSMEYENKLAKIQKQKSQILQNNQQATNQDIFRKKLQHMKKTHEEEVAALKQHIRQLQEQTDSRPQASPVPQPSHFNSAFSTRNKRK
ncbi:coiled-coil domain-containing protein 152-like [Littorina saxatilis]|uniref:Uncharacterized protein n=1 Tax=Littorina saxatilis TaxID=31220 RepID=A0AAN9B676_9CAEN